MFAKIKEAVKSRTAKVAIMAAPALAMLGITVSGSGAIAFESSDNTAITSLLGTLLTNLWGLATSSTMAIVITATLGVGFVTYVVAKVMGGFNLKNFFGGN